MTITRQVKSAPAKRVAVRIGDLYPSIDARFTGMLPVPGGHTIYFEESGNPDGLPVVFCHGGPGGGTAPAYRQFFNPDKYRIILFDQRGCGQSLPYASLKNNTTWDIVADMELLRKHCNIESWVVFGGSWGSTLALAYAEKHPSRVKALVLRGVFFGTQQECDWFYQDGASNVFPEHWADYVKPIAKADRGNMIEAYYKLLTSKNQSLRDRFAADDFAVAIARIECHYFINNCFFKGENQLLKNAWRIRDIPCVIVNGRYDMVCPIANAHALHLALPDSEFVIVPDAGHSMTEIGIRQALVAATDKFSKLK
jgi:proline iminopeptidase